MCPGSPVCGPSTIFFDKIHRIAINFTNVDQVCVYKMIFHQVDPLDMIPDLAIEVKKFSNVKAELFSKVEKSSNNTYFKELEFTEVNHYYQNLENPQEESGVDTSVYLIIKPTAAAGFTEVEIVNLSKGIWYLSIGFIASLLCCCCFWGIVIYIFCIRKD